MGVVADLIGDQIPRETGGLSEIGIGGFTLFARVRDSYKLTSEVPTSAVETGDEKADTVILKPLTLTISGDVADIHVKLNPALAAAQRVQAEIGNVASQFAPARTQAQLQKMNGIVADAADAVRKIDNLIDTGTQALEFFGDKDPEKGLQEQFLDAMEAIHYGRLLIPIDMPFRRHEDMRITSFVAETDNGADSTTFTIEAVQVTFAELQFVEIKRPSPALAGQADAAIDAGTQTGAPVERSLLANIFGG